MLTYLGFISYKNPASPDIQSGSNVDGGVIEQVNIKGVALAKNVLDFTNDGTLGNNDKTESFLQEIREAGQKFLKSLAN